MKYSIVIPIYNRPDEAEELLESLSKQRFKDYELLMVEDGSSEKCDHIIEKYKDKINIRYFYKENTGPGKSRNYGIERAEGEYVILFDSDCLIPEDYLEKVEEFQKEHNLDCWGGPDAAHESFSDVQKAINFAMTSFITTGGIRGRKKQLDKFQPRSFNMGFRKSIYDEIGGFSNVHPGEDPDFSYRIMNAGYKTGLIPDAEVYHKRRIDFGKYRTQVYKFGVVRNFLIKWYPDKFKIVYLFPSLFILGSLALIVLSVILYWWLSLAFALLALILFIEAIASTKKMKISLLAVYASFIQLIFYGYGFMKGFWRVHILKRDEQKAFPKMFF